MPAVCPAWPAIGRPNRDPGAGGVAQVVRAQLPARTRFATSA